MKIYARYLQNNKASTPAGPAEFINGVAEVTDAVAAVLLSLPKEYSKEPFGATGPTSVSHTASPEGQGVIAASVMQKRKKAKETAPKGQGKAAPAAPTPAPVAEAESPASAPESPAEGQEGSKPKKFWQR